MKKITTISALLIGAASAFAAFPNPITTDTTAEIGSNENLVMGADNITVTHSHNGARHWTGSLDLNGFNGTNLVINNVTADPSNYYFGFNGATFKNTGGSNADTLKVTDIGDNIYLMNGFTVSNMTMYLNTGTKLLMETTKLRTVTVKDNASLIWSRVPDYGTSKPLNFVIGTEGSATDTSSFLNFSRESNISGLYIFNVYNGSFYLRAGYRPITFLTSTIHALSADSFVYTIALNGGATFTVDSGITNKIYIYNNITMANNTTLVLNSEEMFYNGSVSDTKDSDGFITSSKLNKTSTRVALYLAGATSNIILGADNTFKSITNNAGKTLNLTLNGNVFTVQENIDFSSFNLYIADFANDSVKISTTTEDWAEHITAMYMGSALTDLVFRDGFLYSATVPEPAEWAMIFGALALAVAAYRRRK